jgi:hypothetical protein
MVVRYTARATRERKRHQRRYFGHFDIVFSTRETVISGLSYVPLIARLQAGTFLAKKWEGTRANNITKFRTFDTTRLRGGSQAIFMSTHPQDVEAVVPAQETAPNKKTDRFPKNRREAILFSLLALVFVALAVGLGVSLSNETESPTPGPTAIGIRPNPGGSIVVSPGIYALENSNGGELQTVSFVSTIGGVNATAIPAGRSYDDHDWESVYPLLFPFDCDDGCCMQG